jgi:hypothetical protein
MSSAGQKKGIFGRVRAKPRHRARGVGSLPKLAVIHQVRARKTDRCYEPAGANSGGTIPACAADFDHELVIEVARRNKLKNRPK